jgi:hypothetical protein
MKMNLHLLLLFMLCFTGLLAQELPQSVTLEQAVAF